MSTQTAPAAPAGGAASARGAPRLEGCPRHSWSFTKEQVDNQTPSRQDGVSMEEERVKRMRTCAFIDDLGSRLKLWVHSTTGAHGIPAPHVCARTAAPRPPSPRRK